MKIEYRLINKLLLDSSNDRFAELYNGSNDEDDLIEYLLYTEAAVEVAKNISDRSQFYPDEALWVIPRGNRFLVKDGNRRCAAVKALRMPAKYQLGLPKFKIDQLPVLIYGDEKELDRRIQEQHTHSLFREWDRIAKALKAYEMYKAGFSEDAITEIDSDPSKLIKLASFYFEAVKITGEDLKKLLRRGKGGRGGKTIVFERLFSYSQLCGYRFKGKPSYEIEILDEKKFKQYIRALVDLLVDSQDISQRDITHIDVDTEKDGFLDRLRKYGFAPGLPRRLGRTTRGRSENIIRKRGSIKHRPIITRKKVPPKLKHLIDECYSLDNTNFANAKVALARVLFETILKYIVEETKYKNKKLKNYSYFKPAFFDAASNPLKFPNFTKLREKFISLIRESDTKQAFKQFDLDQLHQIIHSYKSTAGPNDANIVGDNLIFLVEFMLQDTVDLIASLDTRKLL